VRLVRLVVSPPADLRAAAGTVAVGASGLGDPARRTGFPDLQAPRRGLAGRLHVVERDPATMSPERAGSDGPQDGPPPAAELVDDAAAEDAEAEDPDEEDDDVVVLSWWQHPVNITALIVAAALMAGMVGWLVGSTRADDDGGTVDVGFLQDMRIHHEQAVAMGLMFLDRPDTEPGLRTVARQIVFGQGIEIGRMIQLLRDFEAPEAAESDEAMAWMGMTTTHDVMPGMATADQLDRLARAEGAAADELFVELMSAHHEGGVHMAEFAAEAADSAEVRAMADSIAHSQREEIAELRGRID
jgi:uncharacterized protein (DUF305 family)